MQLRLPSEVKPKVVTFRIEADMLEAMQRLHTRDGIVPSEAIRRALRPWLEKKGVLKKTAEHGRASTRPRSSTRQRQR